MKTVSKEEWFNEARLQKVLRVLNGDGAQTRIVGGAIRNALMGVAVGDIDMATTLLPDEVMTRVKVAGMKPVATGLKHGTITVVCDHKPFEVTTLRADVETFGRHATVRFGSSWEDDAIRRDLTINGLYADIDGTIIDLVGGVADIETGTIRFIGEAETRITEDYLRIMRFFRFFAFYGSGRPDGDGLRASARQREGLKTLSAERVWAELKKIFSATDPSRALLWMRQTGALTVILPETEKWGIDAITGLIACEAGSNWLPDPYLRLASILPPDDARITEMARRLKFSNAERTLMRAFAKAPSVASGTAETELRRLLYRHGKQGLSMRLKLSQASAREKSSAGDLNAAGETAQFSKLVDLVERWVKPEMPLSGADVIAKGIAAGPNVGKTLASLEEWWIERDFRADQAALAAQLEVITRKQD